MCAGSASAVHCRCVFECAQTCSCISWQWYKVLSRETQEETKQCQVSGVMKKQDAWYFWFPWAPSDRIQCHGVIAVFVSPYCSRHGGNTCRFRHKSPFRNNPHFSASLIPVCTNVFFLTDTFISFLSFLLPFLFTQPVYLSGVLYQFPHKQSCTVLLYYSYFCYVYLILIILFYCTFQNPVQYCICCCHP